MIHNFADKITNYYIKNNKIKVDEKEVYVYSFELLISTLINCLIVLLVALVTQLYLECLIFSICFMTMRGIAGGYHADTHLKCISSLSVIIILFVTVYLLVDLTIIYYLSIALTLLSFVGIILLSPIDSINKPLTIKEYKLNRKKTIIAISFFILISIIFFLVGVTNRLVFSISYPLAIVTILLILGKIKNRKSRCDEIHIKESE